MNKFVVAIALAGGIFLAQHSGNAEEASYTLDMSGMREPLPTALALGPFATERACADFGEYMTRVFTSSYGVQPAVTFRCRTSGR